MVSIYFYAFHSASILSKSYEKRLYFYYAIFIASKYNFEVLEQITLSPCFTI